MSEPATLQDWLGEVEVEGYGVRAERIPPGAYPWIAEAWKLGAASGARSAADEIERLRAALRVPVAWIRTWPDGACSVTLGNTVQEIRGTTLQPLYAAPQ